MVGRDNKDIAELGKPYQFKPGQVHNRRHGPSVVGELQRLLMKKIKYEDPETKQMVKGKISRVIALRLILNACQGETDAIKEIMDRVDGKTAQKIINEGLGIDNKIVIIRPENMPELVDSKSVQAQLEQKPSRDMGQNSAS